MDSPATTSAVSAAGGEARSRRWAMPALRPHHVLLGVLMLFVVAVVGFSGAWAGGDLVLDGTGTELWVRLARAHRSAGGVAPWVPEMWAGTPAWFLAPTFPIVSIVPLAALFGASGAVKAAGLAAQVLGALGVFVLARSLWRHTAAAVVAGLLYGLHPLLVAHLALVGHQESAAVMAATPWLVWALLGTLDGRGRRFVAAAGLLAGVSVLEQPEHVYGLVLLTAVVTLARVVQAPARGADWRVVSARALAVVGIGLGVVAHWLLPFLSLGRFFVLTPPGLARFSLVKDMGGRLGREPGLFLTRSAGIKGPVTFGSVDVFASGGFYLSWVCLAMVGVTLVVLARRARDDVLPAVLLAGAVALWTSSGGVPLASSQLAKAGPGPFLAIGAVAGLLVAGVLRSLRLPRGAAAAGGAVGAALVVGFPYVAPLLAVRQILPFLSTVRFPRLYPVALLGLALGAGFPLTLVQGWAHRRRPDLAPLLGGATALLVMGAFLVDAHPYRSLYRLSSPEAGGSYRQPAAVPGGDAGDARVAAPVDPGVTRALVAGGRELSTGWPYPVSSRDVWRLTFEAVYASPPGWRDAALGLSGTAQLVTEGSPGPGVAPGAAGGGLEVVGNTRVAPMARAYEQVVVAADRSLAPELAVALGARHVGVVVAGRTAARSLAEVAIADVDAGRLCRRDGASLDRVGRGDVASEVASACALHRWVGVRADFGSVGVDAVVGAELQPLQAGVRGVSVWLDRPPGPTEMVVREAGGDGRTAGRELARSSSTSTDDNGMVFFPVPADALSAGGRYLFELSCPRCGPGPPPRMVTVGTERGPGNLIVGHRLDPTRVAAFGLAYGGVQKAAPPGTAVDARRSGAGRWEVDSTGTRPALVVVAEAWFPGWEARVDGRPARVLEADGAFLGVVVGPGRHRVSLAYRGPATAPVGAAVSAVTVLGSLAVLAWPGRRRRRR